MAEPGHNSKSTLRSIVDRIERLEDEKQQIADDIKDVYAEAKSNGFNVKALRKVIRERRRPPDAEVEALVDVMKHSLGMLAETPLGEAAIKRATDIPFHAPDDDEPRVAEPH